MRFVRLAGAYTFYNGNIRRLVPTVFLHARPVPRHAWRYHGDEVMHHAFAYPPTGRSRREFLPRGS